MFVCVSVSGNSMGHLLTLSLLHGVVSLLFSETFGCKNAKCDAANPVNDVFAITALPVWLCLGMCVPVHVEREMEC